MSAAARYVVVVDFAIQPDKAESFAHEVLANANASVELEEGCVQFDVCRSEKDASQFFLYEIYTSAEAFQDHLKSDHFKSFDAKVSSWVREKRVRILTRME